MDSLKLHDGLIDIADFAKHDFFFQLEMHMRRGTCPGLPLGEKGEPWTQEDLAEALAVADSRSSELNPKLVDSYRKSVNNWMHARNVPSSRSCARLCRILFGNTKAEERLRKAFWAKWEKAWGARGVPKHEMQFGVPIKDEEALRAVYAFDEEAYDEVPNISFQQFEQWWRAYPNGFLASTRDGAPFAVTGLFPVTVDWATAFLRQDLREDDLSADTILEARCEEPALYWYYSGISAKLAACGLESNLPAILGFGLLQWLHAVEDSDYDGRFVFVAEGTTDIGAKLLQNFGFQLEAAERGGQKPRFRARTTAEAVRRLLREGPFFARCTPLQSDTRL